jgi:hypothetical protein
MNLKSIGRRSAVLALAAMSVTLWRADSGRADDAAAPAKAGVIGQLAVGSADRVTSFAKLAGLPLPPFASPEGIEGAFPFIGTGKLATDQPIAVAYVAGKELNEHQNVLFVFPVKAGGGDTSGIPGLKKTDAADTMAGDDGLPFRRTDSYLMFGGTVPVTSKYDTAELATSFKESTAADGKTVTPILKLDIDMKTARDLEPDKLNQFMKPSGAAAKDDDAAKAVADFVTKKVDSFQMKLDGVGDDFSLSARIAPLHVDVAEFEKAGLPDDCVLRADACLTSKAVQAFKESMAKYAKKSQRDDATLALFEAVFVGDSESVGLSPAGGGTLFDVVHHPNPGDLKQTLRPIVDMYNGDKAAEHPIGAALSEYTTAGGATVERVTLKLTDDKVELYVDTFAKGDTIYTSWSASDGHTVESLAGLKSEGMTKSVASGWVKVVEGQKLMEEMVKKWSPSDANPPLDKSVADLIGDKPLHWSAENDGDGMRLTVGLTRGMIQAIGKIATGG